MKTGIDPRNDYAFHQMFALRGRERYRLGLVNAVLAGLLPAPIVRLKLRNPIRYRQRQAGKLAILDLVAEDEFGRRYLLEMQMRVRGNYPKRVLYYWARDFQEQLDKGEGYELLRPTIAIHLLGENLFPDREHYRSVFEVRERSDGTALSDDLLLVFVELAKLRKTAAELADELEQWIYAFNHGAELDPENLPAGLDSPTIRSMVEALGTMGKSPVQRRRYELAEKAERDHVSDINFATAQGVAQGEQLGEARGASSAWREALTKLLELRFGAPGLALLENTEVADPEQWKTMFQQVSSAATVEELRALWGGGGRRKSGKKA